LHLDLVFLFVDFLIFMLLCVCYPVFGE